MRVCFDTSFFVRLLSGNEEAVKVWNKVAEMELEPVISVVVLFEIRRLALKEKFEREKFEMVESVLLEVADLVVLDVELALKAAAVSHGAGLAARDAIIYTTARETNCSSLYTADSDFDVVKGNKKVKIRFVG